MAQATRSGQSEERGFVNRHSLSPFSTTRRGAGNLEAPAPESGVTGRDRGPALAIHRAGLGAHLLLPAVSVGAAWLLDLCIRWVENRVPYTAQHHIISGEAGILLTERVDLS